MFYKRLVPLFAVFVCVVWLGAKVQADESPLSEMDPDVAKEYGGKLAEQFNKEMKDLPVKIAPDADKAVGLVNSDTNEGILLIPLKGFQEDNEVRKDAEKDRGIGLCYVFMSPSFKPMADGKPANAKQLRIMKFKDSEGNEHDTLCLIGTVKHVEGDDWQLMVYSGDKEPLVEELLRRGDQRAEGGPRPHDQGRQGGQAVPRRQLVRQVFREHSLEPQGEVIARAAWHVAMFETEKARGKRSVGLFFRSLKRINLCESPSPSGAPRCRALCLPAAD